MATPVKIVNAALEETGDGEVVLRGTIAIESLKSLKVDDYQREIIDRKSGKDKGGGRKVFRILKGIAAGNRMPDVDLGMRGQNFSTHGKTVVLNDPVYIIDGLQRVSSFLTYLDENDGEIGAAKPIGAVIHFKSTYQWEKERFAVLNSLRTPVAPGVLIRNLRDKHHSILTLYGLSISDPSFAMYNRISWDQNMKHGELIRALMLVHTAVALHRGILTKILTRDGNAPRGGGELDKRARNAVTLDRIAKEIGLNNFRENIKDFFEVIDECWGIREISFAGSHDYLKGTFLLSLGLFFANNPQLWDDAGKRIKCDRKFLDRLKTFPIRDPKIRALCSSGAGVMIPTLYDYILRHMNYKRKASHLYKGYDGETYRR